MKVWSHRSVQSRDLVCTEATPLVVYHLQCLHVCLMKFLRFNCEIGNDLTFLDSLLRCLKSFHNLAFVLICKPFFISVWNLSIFSLPYWRFFMLWAKSVRVHESSFLTAVSFVCLCWLLTKSILYEQQGDLSLWFIYCRKSKSHFLCRPWQSSAYLWKVHVLRGSK